jgi:hypothetical protein
MSDLKQIKESLSITKNTIYNSLLNDNLSFERVCEILKQNKVKSISRIFLKGLFGIKKTLPFKVEIFLTIFLIYRHSKHILQDKQIDKNLFQLVSEIITLLTIDILKNKTNIRKKLIEFNEKFQIWKTFDLQEQLKLYSETYYELELLKLKTKDNKETGLIYENSIMPLQTKIKDKINYLAGNVGLEYLEKYKTTHLKLTVMLEKKLRVNLKKAFWNSVREDLMEDPPNYKQFSGIFKDINLMLKSIVQHSESQIQAIESIMDISFWDSLIDKKVMSNETLLRISISILDLLKTYGLPERDSVINKWITKINKELENLPDFVAYEFFPKYFEFIMSILEEIQKCMMHAMITKSLQEK